MLDREPIGGCPRFYRRKIVSIRAKPSSEFLDGNEVVKQRVLWGRDVLYKLTRTLGVRQRQRELYDDLLVRIHVREESRFRNHRREGDGCIRLRQGRVGRKPERGCSTKHRGSHWTPLAGDAEETSRRLPAGGIK